MKTIRIFISSPGDVGRERELAGRIIARVQASFGRQVTLESYFWEHEPMRATTDFQSNISDPAEFDVVVCILWSRLGSRLHSQHQRPDGTTYASGTEYEFERAVEGFRLRGSPDFLIYRRQETPLFPPEPKAKLLEMSEQWEALKAFCERWFKDVKEGTFIAAYNSYTDLSEFEENFEYHLRKIVAERLAKEPGTGGGVSTGLEPTWAGDSPYRGLKVFDFEHEAIFFGRTKATDEILRALRKRAIEDQCPFVLILGASGSGKSSLLRAGVIPLLVRPGVMDGIGLWRRLLFRPSEAGGDLFCGFAAALLSSSALPELGADGTTAEELAAMMRQAPEGVGLLLKEALSRAARERQLAEKMYCQPVARLAVGVDQLEELFTDARLDAGQRRAFVLAMAALARSGYAWVMATLRSDFYHRCEEVPELVELKHGAGQYHLLPPTSAELGRMIRLPAEAAGKRFEEDREKGRLDDVIRDAALSELGSLPLLEFALDELFRAAQSHGELTHADYEKIGGVEGALAKQAEETFQELSETARQAFKPVFQRLVSLGKARSQAVGTTDDLAAVRQTASLEEVRLCDAGAAEMVDGLIAARLLTTDRREGGQVIVTVSHEALLRSWERLRHWIADHRDLLQLRGEVANAEEAWRRVGRKSDYLLAAGLPLEKARQVQVAGFLNQAQNEFVNASMGKARRRMRLQQTATIGAMILAIAACVGAWFAKQQAKRAKDTLSQSDFLQAVRLIDAGKGSDGLAYLTRSLSANPGNEGALVRLATCLTEHSWEVPTLVLRHDAAVDSAQFSLDGKRIVTASEDKTARVWDAQTGQPLTEPLKHEGWVGSAQFSPDGKRIVTASLRTARVWDAQTGQPLTGPLKHEGWVDSAQFSPDGRRIVTASHDWTARVWDAQTGQPLTGPLEHDAAVDSAQFSPDGKRIVTASLDGTARVWDAQTGQPLTEPLKHEGWVGSAQFSPDGKRIVTASLDRTARVWDAQIGQLLTEPLKHEGWVRSVQFSPDGKRVVTASSDKTARVWDAQTGQPLTGPLKHDAAVDSAQFSPDGKRIVTASQDKTAQVWDAQTGQPLTGPLKHEGWVDSAQFSPDGKRIVTASQDKTARVWDAQTGQPLTGPLKHDEQVNSAQFSADGKRVVTASSDKTARVWDAQTGQPLTEPLKHDYFVLSAQFSPDGKRIVTASVDHTARVWDAQTGQPLTEPLKHGSPLNSAQFSPDGKRIVTASDDHTARVWDVQTGQPLTEPLKHDATVYSAQFSLDGKRIVTASKDHTARVWDVQTGQPLTEPLKHDGEVNSAQFSPDGKRIVTASMDRAARVWDIAPVSSKFPDWLLPLAQAICGYSLNQNSVLEPTKLDRAGTLNQIRQKLNQAIDNDDWVVWGRWFLADPAARTISPFSKITVPQHIEDQIKEGTAESLDAAERLAFGNTNLLRRISQARAALKPTKPE
jgi:WD40 repeat protein